MSENKWIFIAWTFLQNLSKVFSLGWFKAINGFNRSTLKIFKLFSKKKCFTAGQHKRKPYPSYKVQEAKRNKTPKGTQGRHDNKINSVALYYKRTGRYINCCLWQASLAAANRVTGNSTASTADRYML